MCFIAIRNGLFTPLQMLNRENLRMSNIETQTGQKTSENIKITKMLHKLSSFCKVVEISGYFNNASHVMVSVLLVRGLFYSGEQIVKVLVSD